MGMARPRFLLSAFGLTHSSLLLSLHSFAWTSSGISASRVVQLGSPLASRSSAHVESASAVLKPANSEFPLVLHSFAQPGPLLVLTGMARPSLVFSLFALGFTYLSLLLALHSLA